MIAIRPLSVSLLPVPVADGVHSIRLDLVIEPVADGVHSIRLDLVIDDFAVCASCGGLVFVRLVELHRRQCEARSYDLEPLTPGEVGL